MSDHKGARLVQNALPSAYRLIADCDHDSAWLRDGLKARGIKPSIPSIWSQKVPFTYDKPTTASATRSKFCSPNSQTGGASPRAVIDVPTRSQPYASPPQSSSSFD